MSDKKLMVVRRGEVGRLQWWLSQRGAVSDHEVLLPDPLHDPQRLRPRLQATVERRPRSQRTHPPPTT